MGICLSQVQETVTTPQSVLEPVPQERPQLSSEDIQLSPLSKKRLSKVNPEEIPDVLKKNEVVAVRVIDVHDGDTIKVLFEFGGEIIKISIRILGIDTPEVTAGKGRLPQEKIAGLKAKEFVRETRQRDSSESGKEWRSSSENQRLGQIWS
jgi:endonuclease YncB( thermonuclease family)